MENHLIKYLFIAFVLFSVLACKKRLDVFPTTSEVDGNIITDLTSAKSVLNGVYYRFANAYNQHTQWAQVQELPASLLSGLIENSSGGLLSSHIILTNDNDILQLWSYYYTLINSANGFIKNVEPVTNINSTAKREMIAEVKFLRAYANTNLLLYFGEYYNINSPYGVMLRKEFVNSDNLNLPRSSVAETYDFILTDLDSAIAVLPTGNIDNTSANVWAAKLLKARLLINRQSEGDYQEIINLTKDIIADSPYSLEDSVKDIFWTKNLASNEVILGIQPFTSQTDKYSTYFSNQQNCYLATGLLINLLNDDPRRNWLYKRNNVIDFDNCITKYYTKDVNNLTPDHVAEYSYALRLTEAYLLEAEAIVALGGELNSATTLLKTVLQHADVTNFSFVDAAQTPVDIQLLIIKEEMKNFVCEAGQDWFALRRLPLETVQTLIPDITDKKLLILPIPQDEMNKNNEMIQNSGY